MQNFRYLDKKRHGTENFPVEFYYVDSHHPRYLMAFHWHNEWELIRVLEGEFRITLNDTSYTLGPTESLLIPPETLHGGEPIDCVYECLVFDLYALFMKTDVLKPYLSPFYNKNILPISLLRPNEPVVSALMDPFCRKSGGTCPELDTISGIIRLFSLIIGEKRYLPETTTDKQWSNRIKPVLEYIDAHFEENLTLDALADLAGMNSRYFCKVFSSLTHHTPMEYVNLYRIEHAAFLLESTNYPITRIATDCGFWESSYFTKVFKKYKHCTPKKYRANIKAMK